MQRCPAPYGSTDHAAPGWRQRLAGRAPAGPAAARQLSLGLVIGEAALAPALIDRLFETGSLDRLYRVRTADPGAAARALASLGRELEPMADYVQLLVWRAEGTGALALPAAARRLDLGAASALPDRLLGLLAAGDAAVLDEDALVAGLGLDRGATVGAGAPVRLLRLAAAPSQLRGRSLHRSFGCCAPGMGMRVRSVDTRIAWNSVRTGDAWRRAAKTT